MIYTNRISEPTAAARSSSHIQWPDHISDKTLEKMAATILGSNSPDQLFYQYSICIYVKAIFHLYQKPRAYKDPLINDQFLRSKKAYEVSALHALQNLNFLNPPSLPFIQSLISAVCLLTSFCGTIQIDRDAGIVDAISRQHEPVLDFEFLCCSSGCCSRLSRNRQLASKFRARRRD